MLGDASNDAVGAGKEAGHLPSLVARGRGVKGRMDSLKTLVPRSPRRRTDWQRPSGTDRSAASDEKCPRLYRILAANEEVVKNVLAGARDACAVMGLEEDGGFYEKR